MISSQTLIYITGALDLIQAIGSVALAAGWTLDRNDSDRVHISGALGHFEFWSPDNKEIWIVHCTGYNAGETPENQPGAGSVIQNNVYYGDDNFYGSPDFIVVANSESLWVSGYLCWGSSERPPRGFGVGQIVDKIGSWTGGLVIMGSIHVLSAGVDCLLFGDDHTYNTVLVNGSWTPRNAAGGVLGKENSHRALRNEQPNYFNGGILPQPVLLFQTNDVDDTLLHPLGYVDGLLYVNGGDVYFEGDEFAIGADTYRYFPTLRNIAIKNV